MEIVISFARGYGLTERETEIVYYLSRYGYNNRTLANELFIAEKTVKNHMANIQNKTRTSSTRELLSLIVVQSLMHQQHRVKVTIANSSSKPRRDIASK
nr:LuxR C-terminal-related transcriptional regulator [Cohnella sp. WQ 127256]